MNAPVAVLCCSPRSAYKRLPGVECYDVKRDVRTFAGGSRVVAHPPCRSWSAFCAHQAKPEPGEKELGPFCVEWLRKCGGVLEHPAFSGLFAACGLPQPGERNGDLWTTEVWQSWWNPEGQQKRTWLTFAGISPAVVHYPFSLKSANGEKRRWQTSSAAGRSATSPAFAEWLVETVRAA